MPDASRLLPAQQDRAARHGYLASGKLTLRSHGNPLRLETGVEIEREAVAAPTGNTGIDAAPAILDFAPRSETTDEQRAVLQALRRRGAREARRTAADHALRFDLSSTDQERRVAPETGVARG